MVPPKVSPTPTSFAGTALCCCGTPECSSLVHLRANSPSSSTPTPDVAFGE
jgi:hypothetical protein